MSEGPFTPISPKELTAVQEVAEARACAAGEVIFREGDAAEHMFVILRGGVEVRFDDGRDPLALVSGDVFGELPFVTGSGVRLGTVVANQPGELLALDEGAIRRLSETQPTLLVTLLGQASRSLLASQERLNAVLRRSNSQMRSLLEACEALTASLDAEQVSEAVIQQAAGILDCESASLLLLDPQRERLVFQVALGDAGALLRGKWMESGKGIAGQVIQTREALIVNDVEESEHFFQGIDERTRIPTRAVLAVPVRRSGEILGVVEVLNPRGRPGFSGEDLRLLEALSNLVGAAMHNAEAFTRARREYLVMHDSWLTHPRIIGRSKALKKAMQACRRVARVATTVLINGETGTGKELVARLIHEESPRADRPFVAVNCAALSETLLESELFGHEKGAFTGAVNQHRGRFEMADGGTLFLDEVGEISLVTQAKLLRVLQEKEFVRVGGTETITCDVRIIAATNRDLKKLIEAGKFREDLYYRLSVFPIGMPSLRERVDDIPHLVEHFIGEIAPGLGVDAPGVSPRVMAALMRYHWPGNIRELRNIVERCILLCEGEITLESLPPEIAGLTTAQEAADSAPSTLAEHERALILKALTDTNWNQSAAARQLGIGRDHLRYRLKKYGLKKP